MKISNISVSTYSGSSQYAIGWHDKEGNRYHVWLERVTRERQNDILYKNPPNDVKYKGEGYFPTRRLDVTSKSHFGTFQYVMAEATRLQLFEQKEARVKAGEDAEAARNRIAYVERCKKEAGPVLYAALRALVDVISNEHPVELQQAIDALKAAQPEALSGVAASTTAA